MPHDTTAPRKHTWRFFRAGGFDQVRMDRGADLAALDQLDQKLWVALACPTRGLEFDAKTLDLLDTDHDGRIRAPEILAAVQWACGVLNNPDQLTKSAAALPLDVINQSTPEGQQLHASAKQILANLGKPDAGAISPEDTADTVKIFALTKFNGDGIVPPESADDPALAAVIADIMTCVGPEIDRSGKPGINQAKADAFFVEARALADHWAEADSAAGTLLPLGPATADGFAALSAVRGKIDDYFARCRLVAFDARSAAALNRPEADYLALADKDLTLASPEIAAFPLARIEASKPLPLSDAVNPAWAAAIAAFATQVVKPLLGEKSVLLESDWQALCGRFAAYQAWAECKAGALVAPLGLKRVRELLGGTSKAAIDALIARDKALEPQANAIDAVDRLVRYHRDLYKLLHNFVSFRDFYRRREKAVFQAGTLYLDQRSCELCVRVDDMARHGAMAHLSYTYLAYCDCVRRGGGPTGEKMTIAAAFTAGDSDNLMIGRNGVFYDRQGQDWDATISKIVQNPISIRQAFWAPYKRVSRLIGDQLAKRAAAADAAASDKLQTAVANAAVSAATGNPPPPPPPKPKIDVGTLAAIGLVLSSVVGFLTGLFVGFLSLGWLMPLALVALILLISFPSMILAWFKLRQRNLGPILDANGWAVNAKAKINIPFGGSLTAVAKLPAGSQRDLVDPYAEKKTGRTWAIVVIVVIVLAGCCWYFGCLQQYLPAWVPKSGFVIARENARQEAADKQAADKLLTQAADDMAHGKLDAAGQALDDLDAVKSRLPATYLEKIAKLRQALLAAKAAPTTLPAGSQPVPR